MKKNDRNIQKKNYLYFSFMILLVVFFTFLIFDINKNYHLEKLKVSYLNKYITEVNIDDLNNILTEPSSELFIFVTKTNDEDVYNLEATMKKVIKNRDIRDNIIYIDYTDKENELDKLNNVLESNIKKIPALVYYKDGEFVKSIDSSNALLTSGSLEQILDEYEVN